MNSAGPDGGATPAGRREGRRLYGFLVHRAPACDRRRGRGGLRHDAEPLLEAESGLLQQHAQAIYRPMPARTGIDQQRGLEWHADHVANDRASLQRAKVDLERWLSDHAERGAIDKEICRGKQRWQRIVAVAPYASAKVRDNVLRPPRAQDPRDRSARRCPIAQASSRGSSASASARRGGPLRRRGE